MKHILLTGLITGFYLIAFGQKEAEAFKNKQLHNPALSPVEYSGQMINFNFSPLFTHANNARVYGFIGNDYERIRIKFISVIKSRVLGNTYYVTGKSMVKNNRCDFRGTLTLSAIRKFKETSYGVDNEYKNKGVRGQLILVGDYFLQENKRQPHSGTFKGSFCTDFYIDKDGQVRYDDINLNADGYDNNQFVGEWSAYGSKQAKRCNWGDFRIPNSGDLDVGADEFSPDEKYLKNGWQNLRDAQKSDAKAKQIEEMPWWK